VKRAYLIAAILTGFIFITATAFGNLIVDTVGQFIFGESVANRIIVEDHSFIEDWRVMNIDDKYDSVDYSSGLFYTIEEAREVSPFFIKEPSYLPDSVIGLYSVSVNRVVSENPVEDSEPMMHFVNLSYEVAFEYEINGEVIHDSTLLLHIMQIYGGPDAYISFSTGSPIEIIMIGNNEAALVRFMAPLLNDDGVIIGRSEDIVSEYSLRWMNDGIAYIITSSNVETIDLETLIRIAESIN
jgi:hypothetical protein